MNIGGKMKKQMVLTLQMAIFFLIVFVSLGMIVLHEKGNILLYPVIEKKLQDYFQKHYSSIMKEVKQQDLKFSFKDKSYQFTYQNEKNKDLTFTLTYTKEKKIISTYQQDYVQGKSFLKAKGNEVKQELKEALGKADLLSTVDVETISSLDMLTQKQKKLILQPGKEKTVPFYTIVFSVTVPELTAKEMVATLKEIDTILKAKKFTPLCYQGKFVLSTDGTKGFLLKNVSRQMIQEGDLENSINLLYQSKMKKSPSGFEMEEI